jgi:FtsH-binding integral membrane protein
MSPLTNSYLTILGGLVLVFLSAQNPVQIGLLGALLNILLTFVLLFVLMYLQPGPLKWFVFGVFVLSFGQLLSSSEKRGVLSDVLLATVGIVLAVTALAFWDTGNRVIGWGSYLFAGLIGLVVARFAVLGASFFNFEVEKTSNLLSVFASVLFAAYLAYDTQMMRVRISKTKGKHDYVEYALGPFLDIVNLFVSLEDLTN